ncbi:MAG: hypothetical protein GEU79_01370 [Acidimicrobiia bacterium]|nr:hypothetical protein [Acidimicrobiia bacterium]
MVTSEPLGVVAAVNPFNARVNIAVHKVVPQYLARRHHPQKVARRRGPSEPCSRNRRS